MGPPRIEIVSFEGELDLDREPVMDRAVDEALAIRPDAVQVDLSAVTFIDSSGLRALYTAHRRAEAAGVDFTILGPVPKIMKLFEVTGLDQFFTIEPR